MTRAMFSSRKDRVPIFSADGHSSEVEFLETRRGDQIISGVSLHKNWSGRIASIQVAENFAHRDVLVDDVVADYFPQVVWMIFRRAVQPLHRASNQTGLV